MSTTNDNLFINSSAEKAVLGAAMLDADAAKHIARLPADIMRDAATALVFDIIKALQTAGQHVDVVTVSAELDKRQIEAQPLAVDMSYLIDCTRGVPAPSIYTEYIPILEECRKRRTLYELGTQLRDQISNGAREPDEVRQWAARAIKESAQSDNAALIPLSDALVRTYAQIEEDHTKDEETGDDGRIYSGITSLDEKLGGLKGGLYVAIGARPGVGKSALALRYCAQAATNKRRALLVSLEMDEIQITQRLLADFSGVPLKAITGDPLDDDANLKLGNTMLGLSAAGLWYSTTANTVEKIAEAAYQLYENGGLDLIAIDYLQLMDATYSKKNGRQEQISEISRGLRKLAAELKIPILVLTQLNRESVKAFKDENGKPVRREPSMSDARESGSIEQDANIFILLHQPTKDEMPSDHAKKIYEKVTNERGMRVLKILIEKNRQGKCGRLDVAFDGDHMRFYPLNGKTEEKEEE
ncbi:MAG: AAA family ATPase [Clostridia bacterium]|nr:AAA family ATPase [Clostridia bacterium]